MISVSDFPTLGISADLRFLFALRLFGSFQFKADASASDYGISPPDGCFHPQPPSSILLVAGVTTSCSDIDALMIAPSAKPPKAPGQMDGPGGALVEWELKRKPTYSCPMPFVIRCLPRCN